MNEQSECSSVVCVVRTELYGSTMEFEVLGSRVHAEFELGLLSVIGRQAFKE